MAAGAPCPQGGPTAPGRQFWDRGSRSDEGFNNRNAEWEAGARDKARWQPVGAGRRQVFGFRR